MADLPTLRDASLSLDGRVATLTMSRDEVRNALTGTSLADDIVTAVTWASGCEEVSVLVITGAGAAFSSGGNIKDMRARAAGFSGPIPDIERAYRTGIQRLPLALARAELPLIAAVNGPAVGAGCDLACMCDLRVGSTAAAFAESFVNLGIIPGDGGGWFLQRTIGYARAAEMTLTGRMIDARTALAYGLLNELVEPDRLMARAGELAAEIAAKPPQALRYAKRLLKIAQRTELPDFLDLCAVLQGVCHNTDDHLEAISAFLDKRTPHYQGR
ncbi:MAG TPA: enoyl-CoA hydratase-related protein [Alphaproteobacteria bacterium]